VYDNEVYQSHYNLDWGDESEFVVNFEDNCLNCQAAEYAKHSDEFTLRFFALFASSRCIFLR